MLANRLVNRQRHLRKWARRRGITCYRVYERDIPDYPVVVDWYDGDAVVWIHARKKDETPEACRAYEALVVAEICAGLEIERTRLFVKERRRQRFRREGQGQYERVETTGYTRTVDEGGLKFEVNLTDYLDTGLFLDHRDTRRLVRERSSGRAVLNLFSYTGSFSVYAAAGGASRTESVDLSATYLRWTERNFALNSIALGRAHRLTRADCLAYLDERHRAGDRFDLVVCDPPTFSNSKRMDTDSFSVERDHPMLLKKCVAMLNAGGEVLFSTNARGFELRQDALPPRCAIRDMTASTTPEDFTHRPPHGCWRISLGSA